MDIKNELLELIRTGGKSTKVDGTESILALFKGELVEIKLSDVINTPSAFTKLTLNANGTLTIPAGYVINELVIFNTTANAITGGVRVGTTNGGTQVIVAQAVGANALIKVTDAVLLLKVFSMTLPQILYIQAVTAWNSANIEIYVELKRLV